MREKGRDDDEERVRAQSISGEVTEPHIERNSENKASLWLSDIIFSLLSNCFPFALSFKNTCFPSACFSSFLFLFSCLICFFLLLI